MGCFRYPGYLNGPGEWSDIGNGTLCHQPAFAYIDGGFRGLSDGEVYERAFLLSAGTHVELPTPEDEAEFAVVKKFHGCKANAERYKDVRSYFDDRHKYFGDRGDYSSFSAEADAELAAHPRMVRMMPDELVGHPDRQKVFYRWVRMAYQRKYGKDVDVPAIISRGMTKELNDKIAKVRGSVRVKKAHDENFQAGGFNARPEKLGGCYRLGTLSEHASGMAADINDSDNAQFTLAEWDFILALVGKKVARSKSRWKTEEAATGLHADILAVSSLFVTTVAAKVAAIAKARADAEKAAKAAGKPAPPASKISPLEEVLGKHSDRLSPWTDTGFFNLPLELVLEFRAAGFDWGALFSGNVDLHHFELPDVPPAATKPAAASTN